jgi:hypothetical protein
MSSLASTGAIDYKTLVQDDRIHASLYTDARIFDDEMERIFRRSWVFVGHDSEIPHPGDFVTRAIGTEPVIMVRAQGRRRLRAHQPVHAPGNDGVSRGSRPRADVHLSVPRLGVRPLGRAPRRAVPRRLRSLRQERAPARPGAADCELSRIRLREPERNRDIARRAPGVGHPADRPLLRSVTRRRGRAHGRLGEAPLRRQLEGAP